MENKFISYKGNKKILTGIYNLNTQKMRITYSDATVVQIAIVSKLIATLVKNGKSRLERFGYSVQFI